MTTGDVIPDATRVWFLKSMRMCEVVSRHADGLYTVRVLDSGKELTATREGLCRTDDVEGLRRLSLPVPTSITLMCWHCGKKTAASVTQEPRFGFEIAQAAQAAGWHAAHDARYGRVLVFCEPAHADAQKTKQGWFRARPKPMTIAAD